MAKPLLPDDLWKRIEPLLPPPRPRRFRHPGRKPIDGRKALIGILFVLRRCEASQGGHDADRIGCTPTAPVTRSRIARGSEREGSIPRSRGAARRTGADWVAIVGWWSAHSRGFIARRSSAFVPSGATTYTKH